MILRKKTTCFCATESVGRCEVADAIDVTTDAVQRQTSGQGHIYTAMQRAIHIYACSRAARSYDASNIIARSFAIRGIVHHAWRQHLLSFPVRVGERQYHLQYHVALHFHLANTPVPSRKSVGTKQPTSVTSEIAPPAQ